MWTLFWVIESPSSFQSFQTLSPILILLNCNILTVKIFKIRRSRMTNSSKMHLLLLQVLSFCLLTLTLYLVKNYNSRFGGKFNYKFIALRTSRNKLFLTYPGTYKQQSTNCVNSVNSINSFKHVWGIKTSLKALAKSIISPISTHYKPQLGCLFYSF